MLTLGRLLSCLLSFLYDFVLIRPCFQVQNVLLSCVRAKKCPVFMAGQPQMWLGGLLATCYPSRGAAQLSGPLSPHTAPLSFQALLSLPLRQQVSTGVFSHQPSRLGLLGVIHLVRLHLHHSQSLTVFLQGQFRNHLLIVLQRFFSCYCLREIYEKMMMPRYQYLFLPVYTGSIPLSQPWCTNCFGTLWLPHFPLIGLQMLLTWVQGEGVFRSKGCHVNGQIHLSSFI